MRGDIVAASVIVLIGACLLGVLFGILDSDGRQIDIELEYGDWSPYNTDGILGTEGPIEVQEGMIHATGTGMASIVKGTGDVVRIKVVPAPAILVLMDGQSNAAYYGWDGKPPTAADKAITPAPELGSCYYFGRAASMPWHESESVDDCSVLDFVDPSTGKLRVGDKGPGFCKELAELTGKKIIWVSLGIPSKRIAAWDQPNGSAWVQNMAVMESFNSEIKETGFEIERVIALWSQGESDYLHSTGYSHYIESFKKLHDSAPSAWGWDIDGWYLLEGRTSQVGWVNDAFRELSETIADVEIAAGSSLVDTFSADNGLMMPDDLHYSQRGDNALADAAARYVGAAQGIAPTYLVQAVLNAEVGASAEPPSLAGCYRTDGSSYLAEASWDSAPDTSSAGVSVIQGIAPDAGPMIQFASPPMLIVTVEASA